MVRILVMDNEKDILSSLKTILEKENYDVKCVATGKGAIKEIEGGKFDLIILDIMMPDILGWDVFERAMTINPKQKVIFLSVLEMPQEWKTKLEKYGTAEYITKPFDNKFFTERVKLNLIAVK